MSRHRPIAFHLVIGIGISFLLAGTLCWGMIQWTGWIGWLLAWLAAVNLVTFFYYGFDKWRAKNGGRRVPEASLHGLSLVGGSLGAFAGMKWFRHKTIKGRFRILFWGIILLQGAIIALVVILRAA